MLLWLGSCCCGIIRFSLITFHLFLKEILHDWFDFEVLIEAINILMSSMQLAESSPKASFQDNKCRAEDLTNDWFHLLILKKW
jgi:hypothetical protein